MRGSLTTFIADSYDWLTIDERRGPTAAQAAWTELYAGAVAPSPASSPPSSPDTPNITPNTQIEIRSPGVRNSERSLRAEDGG